MFWLDNGHNCLLLVPYAWMVSVWPWITVKIWKSMLIRWIAANCAPINCCGAVRTLSNYSSTGISETSMLLDRVKVGKHSYNLWFQKQERYSEWNDNPCAASPIKWFYHRIWGCGMFAWLVIYQMAGGKSGGCRIFYGESLAFFASMK